MPGFVLPGIVDDRSDSLADWEAPGAWNVMVPVDIDGNGWADTLSYTVINTPGFEYEPYYFIAEPGIWGLDCPVNGARSSSSTQYSRTEWRHWNPGTNNEANTTIPVGLSVRGRVKITELPTITSGGPSRTCFAQFHGASSGQNMRLYFARQTEPNLYGIYFQDDLYGGPNGTDTPTETAFQVVPIGSIGLDQWFEFHAVTVDNYKVVTVWIGNVEYKVTQRNSDDWLVAPEVYIKAGNYLGVGDPSTSAGTKGSGWARTRWDYAVPSHGVPDLENDNVWDWFACQKCKPYTDSYLELDFHIVNARAKSRKSVAQDTQGAPQALIIPTIPAGGGFVAENIGVGFLNAAGVADFASFPGNSANSISWMNTGNIYYNGALLAVTHSYQPGDALYLRISNGKLGFKKNTEAWYELTVAGLTGALFIHSFASTPGIRVSADFSNWVYQAPSADLPRWKGVEDIAQAGPAPAGAWAAKLTQNFTAGAKRLLVIGAGEFMNPNASGIARGRLTMNGEVQGQLEMTMRDTAPNDWRAGVFFGVIPANTTWQCRIDWYTGTYTRNLKLYAIEIPDEAPYVKSLAAERRNLSSTEILATPELVVPAGEWVILACADFTIGDASKMAKNRLVTDAGASPDAYQNYLRFIGLADFHHRFHMWPRITGVGQGALAAQETVQWEFAPNDSTSWADILNMHLLAVPKTWLGDLQAAQLAANSETTTSSEIDVLTLTDVRDAGNSLVLSSFTAEGGSSSISMFVRTYIDATPVGEYVFESPSTSADRAMYAGGAAALTNFTAASHTLKITRQGEASMLSKVKAGAALLVGQLGGALP